jgi:hypothetical protein
MRPIRPKGLDVDDALRMFPQLYRDPCVYSGGKFKPRFDVIGIIGAD